MPEEQGTSTLKEPIALIEKPEVLAENNQPDVGVLLDMLVLLRAQANTYRLWLVDFINEKATEGTEPPPISRDSVKVIEIELSELNSQIFGNQKPPKHLYISRDEFMDEYHKTYVGPKSFYGNSPNELAHHYSGLGVWIDRTTTYLNYIRTKQMKKTPSPPTANP
jgi:hypothetical protein